MPVIIFRVFARFCSFFDEKPGTYQVVKLIAGLFLTFVVINPVTKLDFSRMDTYLDAITCEGNEATAVGENMARDAQRNIIMSSVRSYILDKAETYGAKLAVEVILDQDNMPISVELSGALSPYAKAQMTGIIETDLGISKENQVWIG